MLYDVTIKCRFYLKITKAPTLVVNFEYYILVIALKSEKNYEMIFVFENQPV